MNYNPYFVLVWQWLFAREHQLLLVQCVCVCVFFIASSSVVRGCVAVVVIVVIDASCVCASMKNGIYDEPAEDKSSEFRNSFTSTTFHLYCSKGTLLTRSFMISGHFSRFHLRISIPVFCPLLTGSVDSDAADSDRRWQQQWRRRQRKQRRPRWWWKNFFH